MTEPFSAPDPGPQATPPPPPGYSGYGYQQHGYGYSYGQSSVWAYSGFWRRAGAAILDGIIVEVVGSLLSGLLGASFGISIVNLVIGVAYYSYLEGVRGQTVGKMAVGVKVVDAETAEMIGLARGIGRYFARILSTIVFGLGYFWMLWDPRKQTWHDKLARSVVIRTNP
jgi:uncharacterized RDD family membrane protein YckC